MTEPSHDGPDPAEVLRYVRAQRLVPADCTVEQLPSAAYRLYAEWRRTRDALEARAERKRLEDARWWAERTGATARWRAGRSRRDAIREWGRAHDWNVASGAISSALAEAYAIAEEGEAGQLGLF